MEERIPTYSDSSGHCWIAGLPDCQIARLPDCKRPGWLAG